ncbi:MAG: hypothetical protein K2X27_25290 [Candidatus Obscuribacterales bacterium]|nr:hypothetical protein [Candidatus Obscuribacterales bacterium]
MTTEQNKNTEEQAAENENPDEILVPCCTEQVHIAYRGKADDKLYIAYGRKWQEVRFYQSNGLRVFCASCRNRVL